MSAESCGVEFDSTFRFEPQGDGTLVTFDMSTRPKTLMAKLMTPLGWLMTGSMKKLLKQDMDELAAAAESGA